MLPDPVLLVARVAQALEGLGVSYMVGGSLASSNYGVPRATQDVDLVADLRARHILPLIRVLEEEFYIDEDQVRDAVRLETCFNVIHMTAIYKIDIFILQSIPWARQQMARRRAELVGAGDEAVTLYFCSPEDIVLHKLDWFRQGGGVSDRQWQDIMGVLKVQGAALDREYLRHWADELGLSDLLQQAMSAAAH